MPILFAFGVSNKAPVQLALSRPEAADNKECAVTVASSDRAVMPIKFDGESRTWTVTLAPGDHVVRMDLPQEPLREEPIAIRILEGDAVTISRPEKEGTVVSWPLPASVTYLGGDPKNPWPRPRLTDMLDWFARTLHEVVPPSAIARGGPGSWRGPEPEGDAPAATRDGGDGEVTAPPRPQPSPPGAAPRGSARSAGRGRSRRKA